MATLTAGCGGDPPLTTIDFHILGPPEPLGTGGCPALPAPVAPSLLGSDRIRLTYRQAGDGPLVCDAVVPLDGGRRAVAVPDAADAGPVDLWVEYFGDAGVDTVRYGLGVTRDIDLPAGGAVDIRVWPAGQFACAGALLAAARSFHSATLLPTGEVLLVGGAVAHPTDEGDTLSTGPDDRRRLFVSALVEIYDPVRGRTTQLSAPALQPRAFHQAVLLSTDPIEVGLFGGLTVNGDVTQAPVLVEGLPADLLRWMPGPQAIPAGTEVLTYDPTSATVTVTPVTDATMRGLFAATAPSGPLGSLPPVIAGGFTDATAASAVLRADTLAPATLAPASMVTLLSPRIGASLTPLDGDNALLWGGHIPPAVTPPSPPGEALITMATAPATLALSFDGASSTPTQRAFHAAGRSGDGSVVVVGGFAITGAGAKGPDPVFAQRIRLDTTTLVSDLVATGAVPAGYLDAVALSDGDLLISGGSPAVDATGCLAGDPGSGCATGTAFRYRNTDAALVATGALVRARYGHRATLLADGTVLVSGGLGTADALEVVDDTEIYDPRTADPLLDLAPDVVRSPGDVARNGADEPLAACPIIEFAPSP